MSLIIFALLLFVGYFYILLRADENGIGSRLPLAPRLQIKWEAVDILVVILFFLIAAATLNISLPNPHVPLQPEPTEIVGEMDAQELKRQHPFTQLVLQVRNEPVTLLLVFLGAVLIAPFGEEFFFRLLLQGGWQRFLLRFLRDDPEQSEPEAGEIIKTGKTGRFGFAILQIVPIALFFALLHLRGSGAEQTISVDMLRHAIFIGMATTLTMSVAGVVYLVCVRGMRLRDFGIDPAWLGVDTLSGLIAFVLVLPPMFCLKSGLVAVFPDQEHLIDSIPLFFFACVLGLLFYRTQRIVPGIVLHAALNGTSLGLLLLMV